MEFESRTLPARPDVIAPDGSEIRLLSTNASKGSMVHCRLSPRQVTKPVRHRTVEEMWHCVSGSGTLWRSLDGNEDVLQLKAGVSCSIPTGACFQFRANEHEPLEIVIATMPPWPGDQEAEPCPGKWKPSL